MLDVAIIVKQFWLAECWGDLIKIDDIQRFVYVQCARLAIVHRRAFQN